MNVGVGNRNVTQLFLDTLFPEIEKSMHSTKDHDLHRRRLQHIENFFREIGCNMQNPPPSRTHDYPFPDQLPPELESIKNRMDAPVSEDSYTQLLNKEIKIPADYIQAVVQIQERRQLLAEVSPAQYIEDLLLNILREEIDNVSIDKCIELIMCPLKTYFQQFQKFLYEDETTESASVRRINYFKVFMNLTDSILLKLINPNLERITELHGIALIGLVDVDDSKIIHDSIHDSEIIITLIGSRYIMIKEWLKQGNFAGWDIHDLILERFIFTCKKLYGKYVKGITKLEKIIGHNIRHYGKEIEKLETSREKVNKENEQDIRRFEEEIETTKIKLTQELRNKDIVEEKIAKKLDDIEIIIKQIEMINGFVITASYAVTPLRRRRPLVPVPPVPVPPAVPVPPRSPSGFRSPPGFRSPAGFRQQGQGGTRYKRVKRKYSKMKKYKNKFSKTKKYKNKFSKKKKYKS